METLAGCLWLLFPSEHFIERHVSVAEAVANSAQPETNICIGVAVCVVLCIARMHLWVRVIVYCTYVHA